MRKTINNNADNIIGVLDLDWDKGYDYYITNINLAYDYLARLLYELYNDIKKVGSPNSDYKRAKMIVLIEIKRIYDVLQRNNVKFNNLDKFINNKVHLLPNIATIMKTDDEAFMLYKDKINQILLKNNLLNELKELNEFENALLTTTKKL